MPHRLSGRVCQAPPSRTGYAGFHLGLTRLADGSSIPTGTLTAGCDHAGIRLRAPEAASITTTPESDGRPSAQRTRLSGFGRWRAPAGRHGRTADLLRSLSLSGDWRRDRGTNRWRSPRSSESTSPDFRSGAPRSSRPPDCRRRRSTNLSPTGSTTSSRSLVASGIVRPRVVRMRRRLERRVPHRGTRGASRGTHTANGPPVALRVLWLPDVLRDAGVPVSLEAGWESRGRELSGVEGVIGHHTAGPRTRRGSESPDSHSRPAGSPRSARASPTRTIRYVVHRRRGTRQPRRTRDMAGTPRQRTTRSESRRRTADTAWTRGRSSKWIRTSEGSPRSSATSNGTRPAFAVTISGRGRSAGNRMPRGPWSGGGDWCSGGVWQTGTRTATAATFRACARRTRGRRRDYRRGRGRDTREARRAIRSRRRRQATRHPAKIGQRSMSTLTARITASCSPAVSPRSTRP